MSRLGRSGVQLEGGSSWATRLRSNDTIATYAMGRSGEAPPPVADSLDAPRRPLAVVF